MRYRSKRHYETGEKQTVTEVLNELLDAAGAERGNKKGDTSS
jgi:protein-disulfide isomerase-like protein with CxxC motif